MTSINDICLLGVTFSWAHRDQEAQRGKRQRTFAFWVERRGFAILLRMWNSAFWKRCSRKRKENQIKTRKGLSRINSFLYRNSILISSRLVYMYHFLSSFPRHSFILLDGLWNMSWVVSSLHFHRFLLIFIPRYFSLWPYHSPPLATMSNAVICRYYFHFDSITHLL